MTENKRKLLKRKSKKERIPQRYHTITKRISPNAGRPPKPKLTEGMIKAIAKGVEYNLGIGQICKLNKIALKSYYNWREAGILESEKESPDENNIFYKLYLELKKAQVTKELTNFENIKRIAEGKNKLVEKKIVKRNGVIVEEVVTEKYTTPQWTASAWLLERLFPEKYRLDKITTEDVKDIAKQIKQALDEIEETIENTEKEDDIEDADKEMEKS